MYHAKEDTERIHPAVHSHKGHDGVGSTLKVREVDFWPEGSKI